MKHWLKIVVLMVIVLSLPLFFSCKSAQPIPGSKKCLSSCEWADWATSFNELNDKKFKPFLGTSRQYTMEQRALSDARIAAYKQAVDSMGLFAKRKINEVISQVGASDDIINEGVVRDEMTKLKAQGATIGEIKHQQVQYWEKYTGTGVEYFYVAKIIYMVPRDAIKKMMQDILQKQAQAAKVEKDRVNIERAMEKMKEMESDKW